MLILEKKQIRFRNNRNEMKWFLILHLNIQAQVLRTPQDGWTRHWHDLLALFLWLFRVRRRLKCHETLCNNVLGNHFPSVNFLAVLSLCRLDFQSRNFGFRFIGICFGQPQWWREQNTILKYNVLDFCNAFLIIPIFIFNSENAGASPVTKLLRTASK